jgi:hypothetical protein
MSTVVFLGFAQSFYLGFSSSNEGFQSVQESLMSMVRFTSGDVNYDELQRANNVLAPVLYTMALFVLAFVWTSLLLAIVLNAYYIEVSDVRLLLPSPAPSRPLVRCPLRLCDRVLLPRLSGSGRALSSRVCCACLIQSSGGLQSPAKPQASERGCPSWWLRAMAVASTTWSRPPCIKTTSRSVLQTGTG